MSQAPMSRLTMNYVDTGATSSDARNVKEKDMVLSEGHHRLIAAWEWSLLNIHPLKSGAIGSFQKTHVQVE